MYKEDIDIEEKEFEIFNGEKCKYKILDPDEDSCFVECDMLPYSLLILQKEEGYMIESYTLQYPFSFLDEVYGEKEFPEIEGISDVDIEQCLLEHIVYYRAIRDWFYGEWSESRENGLLKVLK